MRNFRLRNLRVSRLLMWAFIWSIVIHFTAGPLAVWLLGIRFHPAEVQSREQFFTISRSSAIRLEKRARPARGRPAIAAPHMIARPQPVRALVKRAEQPPPKRRELAALHSRSKVVVPRLAAKTQDVGTSQDFQRQERMFARTIERLRQQNDPVLSAARPVSAPAAPKRYTFNLASSAGTTFAGQGILYPERSWRDGPFVYYYVRYYVEYPDGTTETGVVPWPLRYPPNADPFKLGLRRIPLPGPLPGYVLPPDTNLHPLVAYCYEHRFSSDISSMGCPIAHD